jgi:protein-S-isoprenylcysteine O-methyltransferase Ste14
MTVLKGLVAPLPVVAVVAAMLIVTAGVTAGAWAWPSAWILIGVYGGLGMLGSALMAVLRPASFQVRQGGLRRGAERNQPLIDRLGLWLFLAFALGWLAFIPLDVFRLRLLPPPPGAVSALGLASVVAGVTIIQLAVAQNRFAAPTIHDQSAEGQKVIDSGPYALVRHPFYAGGLLVYLGAALWLGSYAAAIASSGFLVMTLARIVIEEAWLREHLPDYAAYAKRVRGRLIPHLL